MPFYRAADFGRYGFEVRKFGRGQYRVMMVDRREGDRVLIETSETSADRARGVADGMRSIIWHTGTTAAVDSMRDKLAGYATARKG